MKNTIPTLLLLSWSAVALAQHVEVDIRPDELLGGDADEQLRELGAQAAGEGLTVTVTSPGYWREMIEEQLRAGAGETPIAIGHRSTFVESVIVRLAEPPAGAVAAAEPDAADEREPAPVPGRERAGRPAAPPVEPREDRRAAGERMRAEAAVAMSERSAARPEAPAIPRIQPQPVDPATVMGSTGDDPAPEPEVAAAAAPVSDEQVAPTPVASPRPEPEPAPAAVTPAEPTQAVADRERAPAAPTAVGDAGAEASEGASALREAEARASLERRLNGGRSIRKTLSVGQLRRGDQLFVTGGLAVAVRPTRIGRNVYWVDGALDLEDEDLRRLRPGKYDVTGGLDEPSGPAAGRRVRAPAAPAAQARAVGGASEASATAGQTTAMARIEADGMAEERAELEARYNLGRPIESTLSPAGLRTNDMLYVGDELIVVVRRDKIGLKRYWLVGDLDLSVDELEKAGTRKYRVRRTIR